MIVRNEAHIIHELIEAVAPHVDCWVIVDTGPDDGTQKIIRRLMAKRGIPGELHEKSWLDFGHNRSEAMTLAQGHGPARCGSGIAWRRLSCGSTIDLTPFGQAGAAISRVISGWL
jgi:glycosyltransferase involved in cell wall biosynthesis